MGPKSAWDDGMEIGFVPMSHAATNFRDPLNYEPRPWHEVKKAYTHFENDDVIFAKVTPCFENGKAALVAGLPNGAGAGSSEFHVLRRRNAGISPSYLLAVIKSAQFLREGEENMTGAVGLRRVPRAFVENFPVRLPPEAEQKRIAQKMDALLAQVDTLKARIDAIPALLKRFRASVLSSACKDSDSAGISDREVLQTQLREAISEPLRNGKSVTDGDGLPVLRLSSLKASGIDFRESKKGDWKELDASRFLVQAGDFLVSRGNGSKDLVGRGGLVPDCNEPMAFPDTMIRVRADNSKLLGEFLCLVWNDHGIRRQIESLARTTAGIWKISQGDLEAVRVPLPSVAEQKEIVRRVEQLFAYADQLEAKVAAAQQRIDTLTQSLLAKAFRGELVPQDPSDEPASVLLERIRAQRAAAPKPKRGRKAATS
ncbi:type I restriction endonuclease subunit S [Xanthomonas cucurbitae]|nr:type I restriction endonuclease subunit S [Xanthomonas cucurbitae]